MVKNYTVTTSWQVEQRILMRTIKKALKEAGYKTEGLGSDELIVKPKAKGKQFEFNIRIH